MSNKPSQPFYEDDRKVATLLAAMRLLQHLEKPFAQPFYADERKVATLLIALRAWKESHKQSESKQFAEHDFQEGNVAPLSIAEIDALCDELAYGPPPPATVVLSILNGLFEAPSSSSSPDPLVILDFDNERWYERDAYLINGKEAHATQFDLTKPQDVLKHPDGPTTA